MFSSNTTYKGEAGRGRKREREGGREGRVQKRACRGSSSLAACVSCVFTACSSLTLSLSTDSEVESKDSHWEYGGKGFSFLSQQERDINKKKKKVHSVYLEDSYSQQSPSFCMCSTLHNCVPRWRGCREMERWTTWSNQALWLTRRR